MGVLVRRFLFLTIALAMFVGTAPSIRADAADDLLRAELGKHQVAGAACLVIQDGRMVKSACFGVANLEWQTPVASDTVFEIGSITKQFTAACVLLLVQDGKMSLDDKISAHLRDTPASWAGITVRHLLTHTSGLTNYDSLPGFEMRQHLTQAQFIARLGGYPLNFAPGERWSYCNSGYNLLGYIVENVSGEKWWDFLSARILAPLQMTNTVRRNPDAVIPRRAAGYEMRNGERINRDYDLTDLFSAGVLASTVEDLAKWNAALDGGALLTPASKAAWWTSGKLNGGKLTNYGFGWRVEQWHGHRNIGHGGATSGFSAAIERFPDDGLCVIILTNTDEVGFGSFLARELAPLYFRGSTAQSR